MLYSDYKAFYYKRASGREPVKDYIHFFNEDERSEILQSIILLVGREGRLLPPHTKHIVKKIWELRIQYMNHQHRIFYFISSDRKIILLTAFLKKSMKTPQSEIKKAYNYYHDYLSHSQ
jgi:phage-related protein